MDITVTSLEETIALGRVLGEHLQPDDCIVACGDLGAGKTQLTKGIAEGLGITETVTSPTFNIVIEYTSGRLPLYHLDLYRLDDEAELEDIGYWDLIESGGACVIEWGDRFEGALPDDHLRIDFRLSGGASRILRVTACGPRSQELARAIG